MSDTGYYPPEYGIEPGERCGRGRCPGRMVYENGGCFCGDECDGTCDESIYCNICGAED